MLLLLLLLLPLYCGVLEDDDDDDDEDDEEDVDNEDGEAVEPTDLLLNIELTILLGTSHLSNCQIKTNLLNLKNDFELTKFYFTII